MPVRKLALLLVPVLILMTSAVALAQAMSLTVRESAPVGKFLADSKGMTLYVFRNDKPNESNCYDRCAQIWPILETMGQVTLPAGTPGKLDAIQRRDGKQQVTYNGWPLYFYAQDMAAGETKGQGVGNAWYVAAPGETAQVLPPAPAPAAQAQQQPVTVNIGPGKDEGSATGTATLTDLGGGKTRVELRVNPGSANMPAHIHADVCPGVGPVVFPLTNVMNGQSVTEINAPLSEVMAKGKAINVHKSPTQIPVYVGCGNLVAAVTAAPAPAPAPAALPRTGGLALPLGAAALGGLAVLGAGVWLRRR